MDEKKPMPKPKIQNLMLENRSKLTITGVLDVDSFNEECVIMETELGALIVRGEGLRINRLNLDNAELIVEGEIYICEYSDRESNRNKGFGFLGRMFK